MSRNTVLIVAIAVLMAATSEFSDAHRSVFAMDKANLYKKSQDPTFTSEAPTEEETRAFIDALCQGNTYSRADGKLDVYGLDIKAQKGPFDFLWGIESFHTARRGGSHENAEFSFFSARIKELDPTSVSVDGNEVSVECSMNKCFEIRVNRKGRSSWHRSKRKVFQFCNYDAAGKAARALRHLISLHGGEPSPF